MVESEGRGGVSIGGEGHEADPVVGPLVDKLLQHFLRHRYPVGGLAVKFKVLVCHAEGHVDDYCDIHAAGADFSLALGQAGLSQRNAARKAPERVRVTLRIPRTSWTDE